MRNERGKLSNQEKQPPHGAERTHGKQPPHGAERIYEGQPLNQKERPRTERQSNIELLRILSMLGVIVLHYNNTEIGGALRVASGANRGILMVLESLFICAVNLYMLISGYFLCERNSRKLMKPLELLVQVILFQEGIYVLSVLMGQRGFSVGGILGSLVPNNYFVILYIVCFLVSPYLNLWMQRGQKQSARLLGLLLLLFSVWPILVDVLKEITDQGWPGLSSIGIDGSQNGYTIVNFALMYCIGAYIRLYQRKAYSCKMLAAALVGSVAVVSVWAALNDMRGIVGGSAWAYCNPFVIGESVLLFLLFLRIPMKDHRWLNTLAKGAFTVYLLHTPFLLFARIPEAAQGPAWMMALHLMLVAVVVYLICFFCYLVYEWVTRPFFRLLEKKWDSRVDI